MPRAGSLIVDVVRGSSRQQEEDIPHNEVKNWALKFGVDLWEFGKQVTKMSEIQRQTINRAISWPPMEGTFGASKSSHHRAVRDVYDFRMSNWFVGAANSPKDLAILIDSATYTSDRNRRLTIATAKIVLDTLGPDDYVNVYRYGENAEEIVQCFKDSLVQASPENVHEMKVALSTVKHEDTATNISAALSTAFEILHKYNRTSQGSQCNQAIMLITSDTDGPPTEVIKRYNWPHMPVRLFTYLIGGDKSPDLQNTACTNKEILNEAFVYSDVVDVNLVGFYARITNADEIHNKVFEYVKVLARPMVLYQHDHPLHWSPAYVGGKSSRYGRENRGQLMTSVTAPILDRRNYTLVYYHSKVKTANLLGIVGTDVPVEEIQKLVPPYKLGVNGYSFIVDNNGRVLYHPDLRLLYDETLKPSYISVDLSEVELAEYDGPSAPPNNSLLLDLRRDMIDQKEGETDFTIKIHYDDMKRVTIRRHNYFYKPIEGTPFSLGLALPEGYGMFELRAEQEIKLAIVNVTEYFKGGNWKVHPDWIYCEYNSASDKFFSSPEERVLHFLARTRRPGWKWMSLRARSPSSHHKQASKPDKDSYYCDKKLVQSLVLDALVTDGFDKRETQRMHKEENEKARVDLALRGASLPPEADSCAGTSICRVKETPKNPDTADPLVTATHAIFIGKGHKAPAAVVGLQFQHSSLATHFVNITSTCTGMTGCKKNCASEELDCYILDNNGFIIISERHEHTGKFFGEIDGTIMDSLVQDRIYRKVTVIDYQGTCSPQESNQSSAPRSLSDSIITTAAAFGNFLWTLTLSLNIQDLWQTTLALANDVMDDDLVFSDDEETHEFESLTPADSTDEVTSDENNVYVRFPVVAPATPASPPTTRATSAHYPMKLRACEKKTDLYILQPERLNTSGQSNPLKGKLTNCHVTGCESVQKIRHTNLILLVVDTLCPCGSKQLSIEPIEALTEPGACTARRERLYRRRPPKCINYHPEEMEIKFCGSAGRLFNYSLSLMSLLFVITVRLT
ncbi:Voltage-dependent calcium channel subunit alpha-2/delta-3 [Temnothorax longispinosus]|uniref:Voltage-dependent calcium channel subunit alpha-2/delta-3 n=1 Tax=Temnothorax longispinosus TaxID=300112 RepID=A0A4S2JCB6_9HYME|nr:Voltage-dependent calcium channel subunit alpha-2/delta-3 [Temnothorax longispinosus]